MKTKETKRRGALKIKLKTYLCLFCTVAMTFSVAACGASNEESGDRANYLKSTEISSTSKDESAIVGSEAKKEEAADVQIKNEGKSKSDISFEEIIVVDNEECLIKITGIDPDNMWGYTIKANFENKSADKTYMYSVDSASINGVQYDPFFATEVAAGKKANDDISFSGSDLEDNDIGDYTDIELVFRVYDSNDWSTDDVVTEAVHIYPYGEDKASSFERESQPEDNIIIDNEYATVIVTGYEEDDIWGYTVNFFLINKTDKNVMFSVDEASVNGYMADPFFAKEVMAGKCAFSSISWSDTTLENNNITAVEEIEFKLKVYDSDNWLDGVFCEETITLKP